MNKLIIFLIRKKFRLKKYEEFRFANQKQQGVYWFTDKALIKRINKQNILSQASLNWMVDNECKIVKIHNKR